LCFLKIGSKTCISQLFKLNLNNNAKRYNQNFYKKVITTIVMAFLFYKKK
jgi:hypothetical protein